MSYKVITPEQAKQNSNSAIYGTDEVLKQLYSSIEANSKIGATSIVSGFSQEAVTDAELEKATAKLRNDGFGVEVSHQFKGTHTVKVTW
mgnify:CR=1 FL=1|jgi:hypothetical protein